MKHFLEIISYPLFCLYIVYMNLMRWHINDTILNNAISKNYSFILIGWHENIFVTLFVIKKYSPATFIIPNLKNVILKKVTKLMGFTHVIYASKVKATLEMIKLIKKGTVSAIAIDGPDGPTKIKKPGAFYIAKKTNTLIFMVNVEQFHYIRLFWRWDSLIIPLPFSKICINFTIVRT